MTIRRDYDAFGLLARWPVLMDESLYRFFQIAGEGVQVTETEDANRVYVQYEREQIAAALHRACVTLAPYLGYFPRPRWYAEPVTVTVNPRMHWTRQTYQLPFGHVVEFGQRATTLISANAAVAYSDSDGDGVDDTATITVTTAIDASEIQVFYRAADGAPSAAHPNWRIEPLTVVDNGATVTITGHKALFVNPALWASPFTSPNYRNKNVGQVAAGDNFVPQVDVYRVYNNTTGAVTVIDDPRVVTPPDNEVSVTADILDSKLGLFKLRETTGGSTPSAPRKVRLYVRAGYPETSDGLMDNALEQSVIHFANTLLVSNPAQSARAKELFQVDFAPPGQNEFTGSLTWHPPEFGVRQGAIQAWNTVKQMRIETLARIPAG